MSRHLRERLAVKDDTAANCHLPRYGSQQRALSGAVGTDNGDDLSQSDVEIYAMEGPQSPIGRTQPA
jgi:hypothetical protein